VFFVFLV